MRFVLMKHWKNNNLYKVYRIFSILAAHSFCVFGRFKRALRGSKKERGGVALIFYLFLSSRSLLSQEWFYKEGWRDRALRNPGNRTASVKGAKSRQIFWKNKIATNDFQKQRHLLFRLLSCILYLCCRIPSLPQAHLYALLLPLTSFCQPATGLVKCGFWLLKTASGSCRLYFSA